jgi:hypothetical protein
MEVFEGLGLLRIRKGLDFIFEIADEQGPKLDHFFSFYLTHGPNHLKCLFFAGLSNSVQYVWARPRAYPSGDYLKDDPLW